MSVFRDGKNCILTKLREWASEEPTGYKSVKFKKKKASISDADLMFVSEYFSLLAYQQIALAEGIAAPPDPSFPQQIA